MSIQTYHQLYIIFLVAAIVLFVLAGVMFFLFDVRKIISIKTGHAMKMSIKELERINSSEDNTGRKKYKGHSLKLSKELVNKTDDNALKNQENIEMVNRTEEINPQDLVLETTVLNQEENTEEVEAAEEIGKTSILITKNQSAVVEEEMDYYFEIFEKDSVMIAQPLVIE